MNLKTVLFIIIFILSIQEAFSQIEECEFTYSDKVPSNEKILQGKAYAATYLNNEIQFYSDWATAEIYFSDNWVVKNKMLRYNAVLDEILWLRKKDHQVVVLNRNDIEKVKFKPKGTSEFTFIKIAKKSLQHPNNKDMFVQLLSDECGSVILLKKIEVVENPTNYKLEKSETYFLYINGEYKHFRQSNSSFYNIFKQDKDFIRQIVKENSLSVKKEKDLVRAVNTYNSKYK